MIRICHIATSDIALRFLTFNQLRHFKSEGYEVTVVCSPGNWTSDIEKAGIKVKTIPMARSITPLKDVVSFWKLYKFINKEKFDIVHTYTPKAGLLGSWAAKFAGVPIIIHSNLGLYFHEHSSRLRKLVFGWVERLSVLSADIIFSVDREDIEIARQKHIGKPDAWRYLGGWVDLERFNPDKFSSTFKNKKKKELRIDEYKKVIGIAARLVAEKGYLELFDAFKKVLEKHPNTTLLVIGPEENKKDAVNPSVAKKYDIQNYVKFLGVRTDMPELYSVMDVFTLPSHREGIGISILEASAMGLPSVSTNVRGCREAVDDGKTGILVPHKNSEKLAEALLWVLEHPEEAKQMGKAGRAKVEREFDEKLVFERLDREYKRLIEEKLKK
ncbi:MAG: glycosyltransferase family 4 protein [Candidatus Colwellbacteria bacterium]|nr:glycosyltransferase family 4 protein [Candidatus Colwellbacteria bacterium]